MQILKYEKNITFHCKFYRYFFEFEHEQDKNWYFVIRNYAGEYVYDGTISESADFTEKQAMITVCKILVIDAPNQWGFIK